MAGYDVNQVIEVVEMLSHSQGFYGRLLNRIKDMEENEPDKFDRFKTIVEDQHFADPVDIVFFSLKLDSRNLQVLL